MVLETEWLRSLAEARAMNYVASFYISRTELLMVAQKYPKAAMHIRARPARRPCRA